jgi:hypothetical protein
MAMHKPKKTKRFQPGGLVDSEGRPVRDSSGQSIMTGFGREEAETQKRMQAAEAKLAQDVQDKLKVDKAAKAAKDDADFAEADRMSSTARSVAGKPAEKAAPSAKPKSGIVTKEQLAKSGFDNLRDYMNAEKGLKRRDGKPPTTTTSKPAGAPGFLDPQQKAQQKDKGPYRDEGRNRPAPAAPAKKPEQSPVTAFPINPGILKQREEAEKKRDAARAAKRKAEEDEKKARPAKEAAERKMLSEQPGAVAYRKKREEEDKMSPGQRSAARGKKIKEFFGMAKGGSVSSASKRADGIAQRGKTRGKVY